MSPKTLINVLVPCFILLSVLIAFEAEKAIASAPSNETDKASLISFNLGITQDPLGIMKSWNDSLNFCQWWGVTCSTRRHQRVTTLVLNSSQLSGTLSPHMGNLSFLREINLSNNSFHGEIPQEFGNLFRLRILNIMNNSLQGEIPVNLSQCSNLIRLSVGSNKLRGNIPVELGSLFNLKILSLHHNNLTGTIPSSIGNLSSLTTLSLSVNSLAGTIPETFGGLSNIQQVSMCLNKISGIVPLSLYNLSSMTWLCFGSNQLRGSLPPNMGLTLPNLQFFGIGVNQISGKIPISLANASGISRLDLSLNKFSGSVPHNIGNLQNLGWLNLGDNILGSIANTAAANNDDDLSFISSLTNCTMLQKLGLDSNLFKGSLPASLTNLSTQLTALPMGSNFISGEIPKGIEVFTNLNVLGLERNFITGMIPNSLGMLSKLQRLYLSENKLSGPIPSSIGNLTLLFDLMLANNNLGGKIPSSLGKCQLLQILNLFNNKLNGSIPGQAISLMPRLIRLNLSDNSLTGSLPTEIGSLQYLETLSISNNDLFGEIPSSLGNCLSMDTIDLQGNNLQGTIPSSLSTLRGIRYLDISRNNLSGRIPEYLENLSLSFLNLSFNNFEGEVPISGIFRNHSKFSIIGNRNLCGGIQELQLPSCPMNLSRKQKMSPTIKILIIVGGTFFIITVLVCAFLWRRKSKRRKSSESFLKGGFLRISYKELHKATNGFNSENLIGVGSFGSVFKGVLEGNEKPIAVKVLNLQQKGAAKTFLVECKTMKEVRHRNLMKILSTCSSMDFKGNDFKALVFELMPNGSLDGWLHPTVDQERVLSFCQRLDIAIGVATALDYLHHYSHIPIVHSDLKPSNVLLGEDMTAHVTDFVLAKFLNRSNDDPSHNEMSSVAIKGSFGYIPPEYGMGLEASMEGDVYSYGILLLEIITGKRPTDEMFKDGRNLRSFAENALPYHVFLIADPQLFPDGISQEDPNNQNEITVRLQKCLNLLVRIGLTCSSNSPDDRMDIKEVVTKIIAVKQLFLGGSYSSKDLKFAAHDV